MGKGKIGTGVGNMWVSTVSMGINSIAAAQADIFAILGNKIVKDLKIFVEVDHLRSWGSSANFKQCDQWFLSYLTSSEGVVASDGEVQFSPVWGPFCQTSLTLIEIENIRMGMAEK